MLKKTFYTDDDTTLYSLLKKGNGLAFQQIYDRYWRTMYGIAYNRLKDKEAAEDVVHDVLASLWQHREVSEVTHLKAYLAAATRYLVLEHLRKRIQKQELDKKEEAVFSRPYSGIDEQVHHRLLLEIMQGTIEKLPERCRLVFRLSREEHLSNTEIAEQLDISVSTVENQLNKALKKLKNATKDSSLTGLLFYFFLK